MVGQSVQLLALIPKEVICMVLKRGPGNMKKKTPTSQSVNAKKKTTKKRDPVQDIRNMLHIALLMPGGLRGVR